MTTPASCATILTLLCLDLNLSFLEDELLTLDSLPNIKHILDDSLKVRCRVVGFGNEHVVALAV